MWGMVPPVDPGTGNGMGSGADKGGGTKAGNVGTPGKAGGCVPRKGLVGMVPGKVGGGVMAGNRLAAGSCGRGAGAVVPNWKGW